MTYDDSTPWYSVARAAAYCGRAPGALKRMRADRRGPAYHRVGGRIVYHRADLDAWLGRDRRETRDTAARG